jgi:hypothetical protein
MRTYVIENQIRDDGQINNSVTARQSFASGLSLFYDRCSKMTVTELYPKVAIMLTDEELNVIEHKVIDTQYVAPNVASNEGE